MIHLTTRARPIKKLIWSSKDVLFSLFKYIFKKKNIFGGVAFYFDIIVDSSAVIKKLKDSIA